MCSRHFRRRLQVPVVVLDPPLLLLVGQSPCFRSLGFAVVVLLALALVRPLGHLPIARAQQWLIHLPLILLTSH